MNAVRELERILRQTCKGRFLVSEPLCNHTSFRVGGAAELLFFPVDADDLSAALRFAREHDVPCFVMGNGTNLLVRDGGIKGLTVHTGDLDGIREDDLPPSPLEEGQVVGISCLAGTLLSRVINFSVGRGLSGLEFAAGIPGTVGGATWMNAGAHGSSFGDIITRVDVVDWEGKQIRLRREDIEFFYRGSRWPSEGIIVEAGIRLTFRGEAVVLEKVKHCLSERAKRLPLGVGMAGSVFKNPPGDYAGRIIESLGMKGLRIGKAEISRKHANVIVNLGGASAGDIQKLLETIVTRVEKRTGIHLESEIDIVGENGP